MKDYRLKNCLFAFYILKNPFNSSSLVKDILAKGRIGENDNDIHLITPILECLKWVKDINHLPMHSDELWGIGFKISALDRIGLNYTVQDCQDCASCKVLTISAKNLINFGNLGNRDIVVLCPTEKERKVFYRNIAINNKQWPCWHWMSLSCKYITGYEKDDQGIDKYLQAKFNLKNYQEEETAKIDNALF